MAIIELSVVPVGTATTSVSNYISAIHDVLIDEENIRYVLTPMSTVIEGELDMLWPVLRKLHEVPFQKGAQRVYTILKVDDRRDQHATMDQKIASVKKNNPR
jgi:uncharacterized protein (TIGR00106 family)